MRPERTPCLVPLPRNAQTEGREDQQNRGNRSDDEPNRRADNAAKKSVSVEAQCNAGSYATHRSNQDREFEQRHLSPAQRSAALPPAEPVGCKGLLARTLRGKHLAKNRKGLLQRTGGDATESPHQSGVIDCPDLV